MRIFARLLALLPLLWAEGAWAVDCPSTSYDLNSQAEVDALGATGCDRVRGFLYVQNDADITNLDGLANLTSVGGRLEIYNNDALTNLDGLANLTRVGGRLEIYNNDALTNLDGLANLTSVGGYLSIEDNVSLANINGLAGLTSIEGELGIKGNQSLENIDGLTNILSIGGSLYIGSRSYYTDDGNPSLTNLDGLAKLKTIGGALEIAGNHALTNVDGLANLTSVEGRLYFIYNLGLNDLNGLANVGRVGGDLIIESQRPTTCEGVAPLLGWPDGPPADTVGGNIRLERNSPGCRSVEEILASVSGPTQPVINQATTSSTSISVAFTPSTTTDTAFPITGYTASCTGSDIDVSESPATDLFDNTPIQETLNVTGYDQPSVPPSIEVDIDISHSDPADLYITLTSPEGTELILWNQGSSSGEDLVGTFPTTLTPVDSLESVSSESMDGDWVLSVEDVDVGPLVREGVLNSWGIRITEEVTASGASSPIAVAGITRGRDYTCTVAPVTKLGTTPLSDPYTVSVPLELPATPSITSTDFEDGKIILTVSVSDNGGTDITGYEATCTDGTNSYTGTSTSSPITVSGLTNDVAYTCTVTATNSVGTSLASAATAPITPEESTDSLPIWLLYKASQ